MARPEATFWGITWWVFSRWGNIDSFRNLAAKGLPSTMPDIERSVDRFIRDAQDHTGPFTGKEGPILREGADLGAVRDGMIQSHVENAETYLDAAVLIFAHSVLDEGVNACRRLLELVDPAGCHAANRSPSKTNRDMPRRVEIALHACGYTQADDSDHYRFDIKRLERLDQLRTDVVHGHLLGDPIGLTEDDVEFLRRTGGFVWALILKKHVGVIWRDHRGQAPGPQGAAPAEAS